MTIVEDKVCEDKKKLKEGDFALYYLYVLIGLKFIYRGIYLLQLGCDSSAYNKTCQLDKLL